MAAKCEVCAQGWYSNNDDDTACKPQSANCEKGSYHVFNSLVTDDSSCVDCEVGTYNDEGATETDGAWTDCAAENAQCSFSGYKLVRYGAGETHAQQWHTDGVSCSNAVFGDPVQATLKRCEYNTPRTTACKACPAGTISQGTIRSDESNSFTLREVLYKTRVAVT